jgi:hypothetical protein
MADKKKTTWVSILIAVIVIAGILAVALAGSAAYFFSRHIRAEFVSPASAEAQFDSMRAQFAGQVPLIELRDEGEPPVVHRPETASTARIDVVRVLAYNQDSGKLVNVSLPLWLLRMMPVHQLVSLDDRVNFDSGRVHITLEDLERHGPGLIIDGHDRDDTRVLVWAE